jgi:hypothetical protein
MGIRMVQLKMESDKLMLWAVAALNRPIPCISRTDMFADRHLMDRKIQNYS